MERRLNAWLQVMVANVRCGEIMREKLEILRKTEAYLELSRVSAVEVMPAFGVLSTELIRASLAGLSVPLLSQHGS